MIAAPAEAAADHSGIMWTICALTTVAFAIFVLETKRSWTIPATKPVPKIITDRAEKSCDAVLIVRMETGKAAELGNIPFFPDAGRAQTYALWAGIAGVAFFAVYPALNWYTALRPNRLHLFVSPELRIPFVPQFIWAYLSMYVLFLMPLFLLPAARMPALGKQLLAGTLVSGLLFLLLPADLGFMRVVPGDPVYANIYATIFGIDRPHNLVPSLHVIWSSAIILACADIARPLVRIFLYVWLAIVVISTVLVHQHHILDVAAATPLVFILRLLYRVPHE